MRALFLILGALLIGLPAQAQTSRGIGEATDVKSCLNCHDDPKVMGVMHTAHAVKADARTAVDADGCQSCHGDSAAHMARPPDGQPRPPPQFTFTGPHASPVKELNKVCGDCHQGGLRLHWTGSQHETADLSCASCHVSHTVRDAVLDAKTQAPVCFSCHAEQRAAALKPSHHPVTNGVMACADCHNPHGSAGPHLLAEATVNDTCYSCHDDKRGPFLWEHAPVTEQCTICHTPHGSVQQALLKQRPPYLCQTCHDSTLHNSQPLSGANLPGGSQPARQLVLRGCVNCHSQVHGSNHPGGIRLAR